MNEILFIADLFANQVSGGGELNNDVLVKQLIDRGYDLSLIHI